VRAAPYRPLNPFFRQRIEQGGKKKDSLRLIGGWPHYTTFHDIFKAGVCAATPLTVRRLERVADAIAFDRGQIFIDGLDEVTR
jgi:hypothetical protein